MSVAIEIDGKRLQVEPGMNVLEAALQNGIYIPHLCHHPDLPDIGSCRLCIVEVLQGIRGHLAHRQAGKRRHRPPRRRRHGQGADPACQGTGL